MSEITKYLEKLVYEEGKNKNLSEEEASRVFQIIAKDGATPSQIAAILTALSAKPALTGEEISGATKAMQSKMLRLDLKPSLKDIIVDNCGTGGDKKGTYNISTAASFVIAAADIPVVKHGNRSVSSKTGSADVLEELGVNIEIDSEQAKECLEKAGICFLFARLYHPAMKIVAPTRQELGIRTIFNLLGPLLNPATPKRQVIGVYSKDYIDIICEALKNLGHEHSMVVHGADGLDEISVCDKTFVTELKNGKLKKYEINPEEYGFKLHNQKDIKGGDVNMNAQALHNVLSGSSSAYLDAVIINAAAGIYVGGKAKSLKEAVKMSSNLISSGKAKEKLQKLVEISNSFA